MMEQNSATDLFCDAKLLYEGILEGILCDAADIR